MKGVFFMEAVWSRTFPVYKEITTRLETLGNPVNVVMTFGQKVFMTIIIIGIIIITMTMTMIPMISEQRPKRSETGDQGKRWWNSPWLGRLLHPGRRDHYHHQNDQSHEKSIIKSIIIVVIMMFSDQFAMHVYGEEEPTKVVATTLGLTQDGQFNHSDHNHWSILINNYRDPWQL